MPRKDTSRIRTLLIRLDLDKPDEAAIYGRYIALADSCHGIERIHRALSGAITGTVEKLATFEGMDKSINPPKGDSTVIVDAKVIAPNTNEGDSTQPTVEIPEPPAPIEHPISVSKASLPPGYGPRQKTNIFQRPIPPMIGRKTR